MGKKYTFLTEAGRTSFVTLLESSDKLVKSIEAYEDQILEQAKMIGIVMAIAILIVSCFIFWYIASQIKLSIESSAKECTYIGQTKDLSHTITSQSRDEIARMMQIVNGLLINCASQSMMRNVSPWKMPRSRKSFLPLRFKSVNALKMPQKRSILHWILQKVATILHSNEESSNRSQTVIQSVADELSNASEEVLVSNDLQTIVVNQTDLRSHRTP